MFQDLLRGNSLKFQKIDGSHSNLIFPHLFLPVNSNIYSDNTDKANILDDYFTHKSTLCDINSILPAGFRFFNSISVSANDLESVLKSLQSDKAFGPNVINNIILKKLIMPFSCLFVVFTMPPSSMDKFQPGP